MLRPSQPHRMGWQALIIVFFIWEFLLPTVSPSPFRPNLQHSTAPASTSWICVLPLQLKHQILHPCKKTGKTILWRFSAVMYQTWNGNVKEPDLNLKCFHCLMDVLFIGSNFLRKSFSFDEFSPIELPSLTQEIRILRMPSLDNLPED